MFKTEFYNTLKQFCQKSIVQPLDIVAKIGAGLAFLTALFLYTNLFNAKAVEAEFRSVKGLVKYETGIVISYTEAEANSTNTIEFPGKVREPTSETGQLWLLRSGQRDISSNKLKRGDILKAMSTKPIRVKNGCEQLNPPKCASQSSKIFELQKGECVVVLGSIYEDADSSKKINQNGYLYKEVEGAWVEVAPTTCRLFE